MGTWGRCFSPDCRSLRDLSQSTFGLSRDQNLPLLLPPARYSASHRLRSFPSSIVGLLSVCKCLPAHFVVLVFFSSLCISYRDLLPEGFKSGFIPIRSSAGIWHAVSSS